MKKVSKSLFIIPFILLLFACGKKTNEANKTNKTTKDSITTKDTSKYYNVSFFNYDNTLLKTISVKEGEKPVYDGDIPVKDADLGYEYDFIGWGPSLTETYSDANYFAQYGDLKMKKEMQNFIFESTRDKCSIKGIKDNTVTSIVVPEYVTSIDQGSFKNCSSLVSITIPFVGDKAHTSTDTYQYPFGYIFGKESYTGGTKIEQHYYGSSTSSTTSSTYYIPTTIKEVIITGSSYIQNGSFYNCSNLTSITISNSVTNIGSRAFFGCIYEILWGDNPSIKTIEERAFEGYKGTSITIPNSVTSIEIGVFSDCSNLASITIPNSVTNIGSRSFYGCTCEILWGDNPSIKTIEERAFEGYKGTSITIPNSVTSIGIGAFSDCSNLTNVYYNGIIEDWCNITFSTNNSNPMGYASNFYLLDSNGDIEYYGNRYKLLTELTIPNTVTKIGNNQFDGFNNLTSITIPNSVTSIEGGAFYNCINLTSITIPNSVTSVGGWVFSSCSCEILWEDSPRITTIVQYAFSEYKGTSITIPESVTSIEEGAFYNCINLTSITIGNRVTSIGKGAFANCRNLTSIIIGNSVTSIGERAFANCRNLTSITIPNSVASIGKSAFYQCSKLTSITIPESVTSIGDGAFGGCSKLVSITIPFVGDKAHTSTDTYQYPFGYIFGTDSYTGGTATTTPGYYTYYIPTTLKEVIITGSSYIQYGSFYNCSNITSLTIPNSVTSIGERAFSSCINLTSITIPNSVTSIGESAFYQCSNLTNVYYNGTIEDWSNISIGSNNNLPNNATRYYYSETEPTESGNYWHYVDGEIVIW